MKTSTAGILSALAMCLTTVNGAFSIPAGTPDGVYFLSFDEAGNQVTTPVPVDDLPTLLDPLKRRHPRDTSAREPRVPRSLEKRDGVSCRTIGESLNSGDIFNAVAKLDDLCDKAYTVPNYSWNTPGSMSGVSGNAVSYVCNYSSDRQRCWGGENNNDYITIRNQCTPGNPSWSNTVGWYTHDSWGPKNYGYTSTSTGFC